MFANILLASFYTLLDVFPQPIKRRHVILRHAGYSRQVTLFLTLFCYPTIGATMDRKNNPLTNFLARLGPGLITGASDDDPSGIGTYSQAGASLGYATLWTAIVTLPLMIVVQHVCAKIGMCSGRGLAGVLHRYY